MPKEGPPQTALGAADAPIRPAALVAPQPLIGYTFNNNKFYHPIRLKFLDRESAVEFAQQHDWRYVVREDKAHRHSPNRWRGEERHRLYKGDDAPEACRIQMRLDRGHSDYRLRCALEQEGSVDL
jgi:hypothetical protein